MKIRTGYVSNSSSTSFILDNKELSSVFTDKGLYSLKCYSTNSIKSALNEMFDALQAFVNENHLDPDGVLTSDYDRISQKIQELRETILSEKVPGWMEYNYERIFQDLNRSELKEILSEIPDGKFITEEIDRDWIYEVFGSLFPNVEGIDIFEEEL